jgi:putative SOS response-associated peptidase YedK
MPADPKQKRKDRWFFTSRDGPLVGIAGLLRDMPGVGQAFTMLTTEPGPDVAPYHRHQVAVLPSADWRAWLDYTAASAELLKPLAGGSLQVEQVVI